MAGISLPLVGGNVADVEITGVGVRNVQSGDRCIGCHGSVFGEADFYLGKIQHFVTVEKERVVG